MALPTPSFVMLFVVIMSQIALFTSPVNAETNVTASNTMESLFDSTKGIHLGGSLLAMTAIAVGVVTVVMGYRIFRATLFIIGFAVGGVGFAMVAESVFAKEEWAVTASWVAFVVGGIIGGFFVVCLARIGVFVVGATAGVILAMILNNSFGYMMYPSHPKVMLALLCVILGLLCGVLALKLEKPVLIVATSLFGAGTLVWGVGYFAGDFPSSNDLQEYATQAANGDLEFAIPGAWCAYLAAIAMLFVLSLFIQFRQTARDGNYHKSQARGHRAMSAPYVEDQSRQRNERYNSPMRQVGTKRALVMSADDLTIGGRLLGIAAIAVGIVVVVLGYRLFRYTLFAVGFTVGGVAIALIVEAIVAGEVWTTTGFWIVFVLGGVSGGCLLSYVSSLGIFIVGAVSGVILGIILNISFGYLMYPSHPDAMLAILSLLFGIPCGILALKREKPMLIVATSAFGAGILVWGIGDFAGDFPAIGNLKQYANEDANGDLEYAIPSVWGVYLAVILVVFGLSTFVQFRKTARDGVYHKRQVLGREPEAVVYVETLSPEPNVQYAVPVTARST
ncbi:hypothetical protein BBJ28_00016276 [Nothophytophthora sp. Chile5]|nr:hypothetical protein BBJ28_00016276 [Nothophytophthora sp. Chile5]